MGELKGYGFHHRLPVNISVMSSVFTSQSQVVQYRMGTRVGGSLSYSVFLELPERPRKVIPRGKATHQNFKFLKVLGRGGGRETAQRPPPIRLRRGAQR